MPTLSMLDSYLAEISGTPLLSAEDEQALGHRVRNGDLEARATMIQANLRLVVAQARRYSHGALCFLDLVAEGNLGLIRAVERFDPNEGCRFSTYASWWIKQSISRALSKQARTIRVPAYMQALVARWSAACTEFRIIHSQRPSVDDIMAHLAEDNQRPTTLRRAATVARQTREPLLDPTELNETDACRRLTVEGQLMATEEQQALAALLASMSAVTQTVLRLRYGLDGGSPMTQRQVARTTGLTRHGVSQTEQRALAQLHSRLR